MKKTAVFLLLASFSLSLSAQFSPELATNPPDHPVVLAASAGAAAFAATIRAEDMKSHLDALASDSLEGRETGTEGQRKAAELIAAHFEKLGLPKIGDPEVSGQAKRSHFQKIAFTAENWDNGQVELEVNGKSFRHLGDFYAIPSANPHRDLLAASEVVFLGYGIDEEKYSDYRGADVRGKVILVYKDEPVDGQGVSHLTGKKELSAWSSDFRKKLEAAHQHGVAAVLLVDGDIKKSVGELRGTLLSGEMKMGEGGKPEGRYASNAFISSEVGRAVVGGKFQKFVKLRDGIKRSGKPARLALPCELRMVMKKSVRQLTGANVLGYIEGADPKLKSEVVVVSAHYDHLGKRGSSTYHGADDNASGTSAVMDIAQAFAEAKKQGAGPRRSVLFLLVSGEEKGLLGSEFYAEHPVFPLENTVANVNVDMVGRVDKKHEGNPNYIYVIGADRLSTELHDISEAANAAFSQLELDYTFNARSDPNRFYYRSDHYNFARKGIPAIFYFSGTHKDYHQPSDTADKIDFQKMEKVARLVFHTTWELANREQRIRVNVKAEED